MDKVGDPGLDLVKHTGQKQALPHRPGLRVAGGVPAHPPIRPLPVKKTLSRKSSCSAPSAQIIQSFQHTSFLMLFLPFQSGAQRIAQEPCAGGKGLAGGTFAGHLVDAFTGDAVIHLHTAQDLHAVFHPGPHSRLLATLSSQGCGACGQPISAMGLPAKL